MTEIGSENLQLVKSRSTLKDVFGEERGELYEKVLEECDYERGSEEVEKLQEKLQTREPLNTQLLSELKELSKEENWIEKSKDKVKKGRGLLRDLLDNPNVRNMILSMNDPIVLLYGSLQFGDPRNCDADLLGVVSGKITKENIHADIEFGVDNLYPLWKDNDMGNDPHFDLRSIDNLLSVDEDLESILDKDGYNHLSIIMSDICIVLTGESLLEGDKERLEVLRDKLLNYVSKTPIVRAFVNLELESVLEIRKKRREFIQREEEKSKTT